MRERGEKMMESYSKLARPLLRARSRGEGGKWTERRNKRQRLGSRERSVAS